MAADDGGRKRRRLSRSGDFDRVYRDGSSQANRYLVLYRFPRSSGEDTEGEGLRLGISVGRKVGGAVQRNRVKRVLRESFWELAGELPTDHDFVLVARRDMAELIEREGAPGAKRCIGELVEERST